MEPNELVDRIGYEIDKYRDAKDCDLQSACIAYLEARGFVCLRKHTEAPTEEGLYVSVIKSECCRGAWLVNKGEAARDLEIYNGVKTSCYILGPLPEGK